MLSDILKDARLLAVLAMGNELRGDDAVALEVARLLKQRGHSSSQKCEGAARNRVKGSPSSKVEGNIVIFEAHTVPEAFVGPVCSAAPSHVLIVDAAELGDKPGAWRILEKEEIDDALVSTHHMPATAMAGEMERRCGAQVIFIGIQPKTRAVGVGLCSECEKAASEIAEIILKSTKKSLVR
jgi:hydrogenase 3 maturation protease